MRIRQCVLDGEVQSHRNLQCLMVSGKGGFCHRFCLIAYMDDLSGKFEGVPVRVYSWRYNCEPFNVCG